MHIFDCHTSRFATCIEDVHNSIMPKVAAHPAGALSRMLSARSSSSDSGVIHLALILIALLSKGRYAVESLP